MELFSRDSYTPSDMSVYSVWFSSFYFRILVDMVNFLKEDGKQKLHRSFTQYGHGIVLAHVQLLCKLTSHLWVTHTF